MNFHDEDVFCQFLRLWLALYCDHESMLMRLNIMLFIAVALATLMSLSCLLCYMLDRE